MASLTLAATTEPQALLAGLQRLRMPALLVQIMGFMIRYLEVVTDELRRMRIARESRGFTARGPRALAGARQDRSGRCSSAPSSAASGCTSRCCRAATPASCPSEPRETQ